MSRCRPRTPGSGGGQPQGIARDAVVSGVTTPRRCASEPAASSTSSEGVLDGHPPAPMAPALRNRSDRDVGSARQVGAVDRVAAPVTNLDASLASHATSSATSCDVPSRPMIGCSAAIAVSAASSRFASSSGVRMNPGPDRVHADVVGGVLQRTRMERARLRPPSPIEGGRSSRSAAAPMSCGPCSARSRGRTPRGGLREDPEPSPRSGSPAPSQDVPR